MSVAGGSIEIASDQFVPNSAGGSIEIASDQFVPNVIGAAFDNLIDLVVSAEDLLGNQILGVTFTVTNSIDNDGGSTKDVLTLSVAKSDTLDVSAIAAGYQENSISVSFVDGVPQRLVIVLSEIPKVLFSCTTTFKNSEGVTVKKPISTGFVEVVFTGDSAFNPADYSVLFEAMPVGGIKYGSVVLGYELTGSTLSSVTYKVEVVNESGAYCYLSNIIKNQC